VLSPDDHSRFSRLNDVVKRIALPSGPSPFVDNEHRHTHGYARPISSASIGRVRLAAMLAEIRAHLVAQSSTQFGGSATVTDSDGALCVRFPNEVVYVVVQDIAPAIAAVQGSIDFLLHRSEDARDMASEPLVVLMVVGIETGGPEVDTYLADLSRHYKVTFRYVTYRWGATSFPKL